MAFLVGTRSCPQIHPETYPCPDHFLVLIKPKSGLITTFLVFQWVLFVRSQTLRGLRHFALSCLRRPKWNLEPSRGGWQNPQVLNHGSYRGSKPILSQEMGLIPSPYY